MEVRWLGHSCFKLEESTGSSIVADPFNEKSVGFKMPPVKADVVTISHNYTKYNPLSEIIGEPQIIDTVGAFDVKGVQIYSFKCPQAQETKHNKGDNLVFKYRMDGIDVCHMGDINMEPHVSILEAIGPVNILFIPVGGKYTIDAATAKEYVSLIMPDIVIPMHYKDKDTDLDIDKVDEFLSLFDDEEIVYLDNDRMAFERSEFDGESTKVVVFSKQRVD